MGHLERRKPSWGIDEQVGGVDGSRRWAGPPAGTWVGAVVGGEFYS